MTAKRKRKSKEGSRSGCRRRARGSVEAKDEVGWDWMGMAINRL